MDGPKTRPTAAEFRLDDPLDVTLPLYRLANERRTSCYANAVLFALLSLRHVSKPL